MIECRIGENTKGRYVRIDGTITDLMGDLGALINSIYNALRDHNPEAAEFFADKFPQVLEKFKDDVFGPDIFKSVAIGTVIKKRKEEAADD